MSTESTASTEQTRDHVSINVPTYDFSKARVAYFSMEIGINAQMKTYAGGLGVLAGDMMKSATDLGIPLVGVTLVYTKGYTRQTFDQHQWQVDNEDPWNPSEFMTKIPGTVPMVLDGKKLEVGGWIYVHKSAVGRTNPIIFLDTDIEGNPAEFRGLTSRLYTGDLQYRLLQEAVLGLGGMAMLRTIGASNIRKYHMNEGHSALLTLDLLTKYQHEENPTKIVRDFCVFTTHTPVSAGHDQFPRALTERILATYLPLKGRDDLYLGDQMNMTMLGLVFSSYVNGVAKRHGEVTREMFPGYSIDAITNGVHAGTWVAPPMRAVFDKYLTGWEQDPYNLRYSLAIPVEDIRKAHRESKQKLFEHVLAKTGVQMDLEICTMGFARRATPYKRGDFLFGDIGRLTRISERTKGVQLIFAGKAHPYDHEGKLMIQRMMQARATLGEKIKIVYLEDYNIETAKLLIAGVDIWLNTPIRPQEASGTSGMKAALNGVPHFSILDGWWIEGHVEHVTGWSIGSHPEQGESSAVEDREDMYTKLEYIILPKFYSEREKWLKMMRGTIAINGSFFHTHRMVEQYVLNAYFP